MILGHRGASAVCVENTIDAFETAARLGADGVELDVRRTADGALAVHHDAHLADGRAIVDLDRAELPAEVPLLRDALIACGPMFVNIEIKNVPIDPDWDPTETVAAGVVELIRDLAIADRVIVSCFGLGAIDSVRAIDRSIPTAWLTPSAYNHTEAIATAAEHGHAAVHPYFTAVDADLVDAAHAAGLKLNTWTVDDPVAMRRLADLGVDAMVTNDVALAVATLRGE